MKIASTIGVLVAVGAIVAFFVLSRPDSQIDEHMTAGTQTTDSSGVTKIAEPMKNQGQPLRQAPELVAPTGFVNTDGITLEELWGKVVMVKFWTFACVNCQRTLPHVNALYEKYHDQGFEIVSVHTPEFAYEHKLENVEAAVEKWGIKFPVVLDNNYDTWRAYGNRYWPRHYLLNRRGEIVYDHIGEGAYTLTEERVAELLAQP